MDIHTFELRIKEGSTGALHGGNCEILMDGCKLKGLASVHIDLVGGKHATVKLEFLGNIHVLGDFNVIKVNELLKDSEET